MVILGDKGECMDEENEEWAWLSGPDEDVGNDSYSSPCNYSTFGYSADPVLYRLWVVQ